MSILSQLAPQQRPISYRQLSISKHNHPINKRGITTNELGRRGEKNVAGLLRDFGRHVKLQSYHGSFDFLIDGQYRVDLKTARPTSTQKRPTWLFSIKHHGILRENCDFYILRLEDVPYSKLAIHLLRAAPFGHGQVKVGLWSLLTRHADDVARFYRFARREGEFSLPRGVDHAA
jgi:hypothetical protein